MMTTPSRPSLGDWVMKPERTGCGHRSALFGLGGAEEVASIIMGSSADHTRARSGLRLGLPLAIAAALSFGMSGAWARGLIDAGWTPGAAVTVRIWVAALVLLIPTVIALRGRWGLLRRNLWTIGAYGLLAVTATQLFYFQAVAVMDVGLALLIEYTAPIAVVLWLWMRRGEKPTRRSVLGAVIAFAGLVLMLDVLSGRSVDVGGILWAFGAMVGAAAYFILSAKSDTGLPADRAGGGGAPGRRGGFDSRGARRHPADGVEHR